MIKVLFRYWI